MTPTLMNEPVYSGRNYVPLFLTKRLIIMIAITLVLGLFLSWFLTATPVLDLSVARNQGKSRLYEQWAKGDVVVMVRHAERCDRSANPCLGSADGITLNGSHSARAVGVGLQRLGLDSAQLIASPLTRTQQTAAFILGQAAPTQRWVGDCDSGFKDAVLAHKHAAQNLVLITHSGCIDQFERKMGVRAGERSSDYTEALFVSVDGNHAARIIGSLDAAQWGKISSGQVN